jgi:hypothetical protein
MTAAAKLGDVEASAAVANVKPLIDWFAAEKELARIEKAYPVEV